ncbi:MAG: flavodoxin family protein [Anaerolineae bacterium]|jgi:flavodoxin
MNALVIYDSQYGHTEQVARAIGGAIDAPVHRAGEVDPAGLTGFELLIVGSPTHGGQYTPDIQGQLEALPALEGLSFGAFDTRTATIWNRILPFGYAAPRIARRLESKGGKLVAPPEGFIVLGIQGPLKDGELARAADWAKAIAG